MKAVQLHITGRVQGVSYRASTHAQARALGLAGWVRNEPDGSVRAFVQGPDADVDALREWCAKGPPHARVDAVETKEAAVDPELTRFEVRR